MDINTRKIEILLAEQAITKAKLASKCGMSRQSVSAIMRRGTCEPITAGKLAQGLGVNVAEIVKEV